MPRHPAAHLATHSGRQLQVAERRRIRAHRAGKGHRRGTVVSICAPSCAWRVDHETQDLRVAGWGLPAGREQGQEEADPVRRRTHREHARAGEWRIGEAYERPNASWTSSTFRTSTTITSPACWRCWRTNCEWRIHEHRRKTGLKTAPPKVPRPPEIATLWHNAFRDQIKDVDPDDIESLLAAAVPTLNGTGVKDLEKAATELGDLATAVHRGFESVAPAVGGPAEHSRQQATRPGRANRSC